MTAHSCSAVCVSCKRFTHRTDHRSPIYDLDAAVHGRYISELYGLAHVIGWKPHDLHDLAHFPWVGSVPHTDPAHRLISAVIIQIIYSSRSWSVRCMKRFMFVCRYSVLLRNLNSYNLPSKRLIGQRRSCTGCAWFGWGHERCDCTQMYNQLFRD